MNCCNDASTFSQMIAGNGAHSFIDKRTSNTNTGTSQTVIDDIIKNDTTSIVYPAITDHYPVAHVY